MSDEKRSEILEKIKKLLAHSVENGATEAEAVAFALKAQRLIAENDIEQWELGDEQRREVIEEESNVNLPTFVVALAGYGSGRELPVQAFPASRQTRGSRKEPCGFRRLRARCTSRPYCIRTPAPRGRAGGQRFQEEASRRIVGLQQHHPRLRRGRERRTREAMPGAHVEGAERCLGLFRRSEPYENPQIARLQSFKFLIGGRPRDRTRRSARGPHRQAR